MKKKKLANPIKAETFLIFISIILIACILLWAWITKDGILTTLGILSPLCLIAELCSDQDKNNLPKGGHGI